MDVTLDDAKAVIGQGIGNPLTAAGFRSSGNGLRFTRAIAGGSQRLDVVLSVNPPWHRGAIFVYPYIEFVLPIVRATLLELSAGRLDLAGSFEALFRQPIDWLSRKESEGYWLLESPLEMVAMARSATEFVERYVLPFVDEYRSAEALADGYLRRDDRFGWGKEDRLAAMACLIIAGQRETARTRAEQEFGRANTERYAPVLS